MIRSPRYPIFVPTKSRYHTPYTIREFLRNRVTFSAVVEAQEVEQYSALVGRERCIVLPHRDQGLVVTRNWIWDYALSLGVARFWTFDDNITVFSRLYKNKKYPLRDGALLPALAAMEDFADRYENLPVCGMAYRGFVKQNQKVHPLILNTRVYSNMLIQTDAKDRHGQFFRNEGFFNDDTDLCLRVLKDGQCTVQFCAFLAGKATTMTVRGGMTPYYQGDGRLKMAQELRAKHPDVTTITQKFGHWQHQVDYSGFRRNKLRLKPGVTITPGIDEYGLALRTHTE